MLYNGKKIYDEAPENGDRYRRAYTLGVDKLIEKLNEEGKKQREEFMPPETFSDKIEEYRLMYTKMLGIDKDDVEAEKKTEKSIWNIFRRKKKVKEGKDENDL